MENLLYCMHWHVCIDLIVTSVKKTTSQDSLNVKMAFHGQEVNYMLIIQ